MMFYNDNANTVGQDAIKKVEREGDQVKAAHARLLHMTPLRIAQYTLQAGVQFIEELVAQFGRNCIVAPKNGVYVFLHERMKTQPHRRRSALTRLSSSSWLISLLSL